MLKESLSILGIEKLITLVQTVEQYLQVCKIYTLFVLLGMNKMVINHLEKLFVTNDAATILRELEVSALLYIIFYFG